MKSFRERLGIRQDFDNWAKGINNTLGNLRKQGFENQAAQNIDYLKSMGFKTRKDKDGNEILSRSGENKNLYKEHTEQETEQMKKDMWNVKKAKKAQKETPPGEPPENPPKPPIGNPFPPGGDELDMAADFYNLCELIAERLENETGVTFTPYYIVNDCFGGDHFGSWENNKIHYVDRARSYIADMLDYYNALRDGY